MGLENGVPRGTIQNTQNATGLYVCRRNTKKMLNTKRSQLGWHQAGYRTRLRVLKLERLANQQSATTRPRSHTPRVIIGPPPRGPYCCSKNPPCYPPAPSHAQARLPLKLCGPLMPPHLVSRPKSISILNRKRLGVGGVPSAAPPPPSPSPLPPLPSLLGEGGRSASCFPSPGPDGDGRGDDDFPPSSSFPVSVSSSALSRARREARGERRKSARARVRAHCACACVVNEIESPPPRQPADQQNVGQCWVRIRCMCVCVCVRLCVFS